MESRIFLVVFLFSMVALGHGKGDKTVLCSSLLSARGEAAARLTTEERGKADELVARYEKLLEDRCDWNLSDEDQRKIAEEMTRLEPIAALHGRILEAVRASDEGKSRSLAMSLKSLLSQYDPSSPVSATADFLVDDSRFEDADYAEFMRAKRGGARFSWAKVSKQAWREICHLLRMKTIDQVKAAYTNFRYYKEGKHYAGFHSVRVDRQFRLLFIWDYKTGVARRIHIEDYHGD